MGRLIDADALLAKFNKKTDLWTALTDEKMANDFALYCEVADAIEEVPTVGGWISVKDRLPKSMINKVLVWLKHEDLNGYIGYGHYEKFQGEEMWYDLEHGERFDKRGYIVTHWMPLPEPPKEEEHECN